MEQHNLNHDYMNEFYPLRARVIVIERGLDTFDSLLGHLREHPRRTYEERAEYGKYDLSSLTETDNEVIEKINECVVEVNEKAKNKTLTKNDLKQIIDKAYIAFDGVKAF